MVYCNFLADGANIYGIYSTKDQATKVLLNLNPDRNDKETFGYQIKEIELNKELDFMVGY